MAQIVAQELGIPAKDVQVEEEGRYRIPRLTVWELMPAAARQLPAPRPRCCAKIREKAKKTRLLLEASEETWNGSRRKFSGKRPPRKIETDPGKSRCGLHKHSAGSESRSGSSELYDPPNLTFSFGTYIAVSIRPKARAGGGGGGGGEGGGRRESKVRRFAQWIDCGNIINPMIVRPIPWRPH